MRKLILGCIVLAAFACSPRTELSPMTYEQARECDAGFAYAKTSSDTVVLLSGKWKQCAYWWEQRKIERAAIARNRAVER